MDGSSPILVIMVCIILIVLMGAIVSSGAPLGYSKKIECQNNLHNPYLVECKVIQTKNENSQN